MTACRFPPGSLVTCAGEAQTVFVVEETKRYKAPGGGVAFLRRVEDGHGHGWEGVAKLSPASHAPAGDIPTPSDGSTAVREPAGVVEAPTGPDVPALCPRCVGHLLEREDALALAEGLEAERDHYRQRAASLARRARLARWAGAVRADCAARTPGRLREMVQDALVGLPRSWRSTQVRDAAASDGQWGGESGGGMR